MQSVHDGRSDARRDRGDAKAETSDATGSNVEISVPSVEEVLSGKWAQRQVPVFQEVQEFGKGKPDVLEKAKDEQTEGGAGLSQGQASSRRGIDRSSTSRLLSSVADVNHDEVIRAIELRAQTAKELQKVRRNVAQLVKDYEKEESRFLATVTLLYPAPRTRSKDGKLAAPAQGVLRRRNSVVSNNRTKMESLLTEYNFRSNAVTTALSQLMDWCGKAEGRDELIAHGFKDEEEDEESWSVDEIRTVGHCRAVP